MKIFALFLPLFSLFLSNAAHAQATFLIPRPSCQAKTQACFEQVTSDFAQNFSELATRDKNLAPADNYVKYSYIGHHQARAPIAVISIHGLWGDGSQFSELNETMFIRGANVMSVVLQGHGADINNNQVSIEAWRQQLENALETALVLGDKVVIMGQSTGGLMAVDKILERPNDVAGLILLEPALRVNGLAKFGACTLGRVMGRSLTAGLGNMMGYSFDSKNAPNIALGCLVNRYANEVVAKIKSIGALHPIFDQPAYLFINQNDQVVSSSESDQDIRALFNHVTVTSYDKALLKKTGQNEIGHGSITFESVFYYVTGGLNGFKAFLKDNFGLDKVDISKVGQTLEEERATINQIQQKFEAYINNVNSTDDEGLQLILELEPILYNYKSFSELRPPHQDFQTTMRQINFSFKPAMEAMNIYGDINTKQKLGRIWIQSTNEILYYAHQIKQIWGVYKYAQDNQHIIFQENFSTKNLTAEQKQFIRETIRRIYESHLLENSAAALP